MSTADACEPCERHPKTCFGKPLPFHTAVYDLAEGRTSVLRHACDVCALRLMLHACAYLAAQREYGELEFSMLAKFAYEHWQRDIEAEADARL